MASGVRTSAKLPGKCNSAAARFILKSLELIDRTLLRLEETMAVNKELLDILVCPKCKGDLVLTEESDGLICHACRLKYEIKDDIPIMLIDEALPLGEEKSASS